MRGKWGFVQTVRGPVRPDDLGLTMMHEHLFCDLRRAIDVPEDPEERALSSAPITLANLAWVTMNGMRSRDNLILDDPKLATREALIFKNAGGGTLVDVTTPDLGRVIVGHMERTNLPADRLLALARTGCYLEYDWFGEVRPTFPYGRKDGYVVESQFAVDVPSDGDRLKTLAWLIAEGFEDRIL